jgi:tetratricopeptide (TPR) repeat protein
MSKRFGLGLLAIGIAALALRLAHVAALGDTPLLAVLIGDGRQYDRWAQRIAGGDWIGTGVYYQAPLYPYLLGLLYTVAGHDVAVVRLLQTLGGSLSCVLLGVAGRRFFNDRTGLIAAGLLAVYPPAIFFDALIQKSSLDLLLMTGLLALVGGFLSRPHRGWVLGMGLTLGLLVLNRENAALLYPVLALWLVYTTSGVTPEVHLGSDSRGRVIALTAAVAVVLLPVGVRNYAAGGEFALTTSQLGTNFYIGNHAKAGGSYESLLEGRGDAEYEQIDATRLAEQARGRTLSPGEVSRYWLSRGAQDIAADPIRWLGLMGRKLLLTINAIEAVDTESIETHADYSWVLRVLRWLDFGVILPLGVLGAWLTRAAWRRLAILYAMFGTLVVSVAAFYVVARYRFPLVPIVLLFAGAGVSSVGRAGLGRATHRRALRSAVPLVAAAAVIGNLPLTLASHDDTRLNIASELVRLNRASDAIQLLEDALADAPDDAVAQTQLGLALVRHGEPARAVEPFRAAVRLQPDDFAARVRLANALRAVGRTAEAIPEYEQALRVVPDSVPDAIGVLSLLAQTYHDAGRRDDAIAMLEKALALARAARLADMARQIERTIAQWRLR